jgi:two-component system chemotaxis sensor kinase CheA
MDRFQKKYIEEANDLIISLETALLLIKKDKVNQELNEEVFRIMHSLKGGSSMFGFDKISELTHHLESAYDIVRSSKIPVTEELLDISFLAVDQLKLLIVENPNLNAQTIEKQSNLLHKIQNVLENLEAKHDIKNNQFIENLKNSNDRFYTFFVKFKPNAEVFDNGSNPLYILDELLSENTCKVFVNDTEIPEIEDFDIAKNYTSWTIIVAGKLTQTDIQNIFIFIEDESEISIIQIAEENLFKNSEFIKIIEQPVLNQEAIFNFSSQGKQEVVLKEMEVGKQLKTRINETVISSVRVDSAKLDALLNIVSEIVTNQARLNLLIEENTKNTALINITEDFNKLSRQLRDIAFDISLVPLESIIVRFKRLVRDLANEQNKQIDFLTEGIETELDKTIIEHLVAPIMHTIRNSIDHGIEPKNQRLALGKPEVGKIVLKAYHSGPNVVVQIYDDGKGIDPQVIQKKAIEKGFISASAKLSDKEIVNLIFKAGFTTASQVTDISGRGVGMDVVKRKIDEIRGEVEIDSIVGEGTTITIKLPLTLSIIDGLLIEINQTKYILPLPDVRKIFEIEHSKIVNNFMGLVIHKDQQYPYIYLRDEFEIYAPSPQLERAIIVNYENKNVCIIVDDVLGEYQAVLKPLGYYFRKQEFISGASIFGDGTVALVLDTNKIIKLFAKKQII